MSYIASVDPGKHACGVAVWMAPNSSQGIYQLLWAGYVKNPFKSEPGKERAERWGDMARMIAGVLGRWKEWGVSLVLEIPKVYPGIHDEDPNDLIDLAGVQGAIVGATGFPVEWSPLPQEWKGQLPKEVSERRVESKLQPEEKKRIEWPAKRLCHNVYDALHLGLVHLEREGLR